MVNLSFNEFRKLKSDKKCFSFISTFLGDEITPIILYGNLECKEKFLLEGGSKNGRFGRYSFLGEKKVLEILDINKLEAILNKDFEEKTNPFPFKGGAVGYISYDILPKLHKKLNFSNKADFEIEDLRFFSIDEYICYDSFTHKVSFITTINENNEMDYLELINYHKDLFERLSKGLNRQEVKKVESKVSYSCSKEEYIEMVKKTKEYIKIGHIFQGVVSRRAYVETSEDSFQIYRKLRGENPSPYMFLIDFNNYSLLGSSPESLVRCENRIVSTNPIAGSRKRGKNEEEDVLLENELLKDEKEIAEHVMLVDLGRNDIGRVSEIGSVKVSNFMKVEKYSHVMHICSTVEGKLTKKYSAIDALFSVLPAGTLSGAPKLRAMEIIEELENVKRGFYGGAVGYFSYGGNMDMCICIRSLLLKDGLAYLQSGAGIVFDSNPEEEFKEVENKLKALLEVVTK